jgi:hypothetical protein
MNIKEARSIAQSFLPASSQPLKLCEAEQADEYGWCWVFYWNSHAYLRTRHPAMAILGGGPVVICKDGSDPWMLSGAGHPEAQLACYAAGHGYPHPDGYRPGQPFGLPEPPTVDEARSRAELLLGALTDPPVSRLGRTEEHAWGWLFTIAGGGAPIIVPRDGGRTRQLATDVPIAEQLPIEAR